MEVVTRYVMLWPCGDDNKLSAMNGLMRKLNSQIQPHIRVKFQW